MTTSDTTSDERTLAMLAHLLGIFSGFIGPLILWLVKREQGGFVEQHAKEALNFQITVLLASLVAFLLMFVLIGIFLLPLIALGSLILCILAAVKAYGGERYRYPLTLRLLR
jgi:hypothetical protein